MAKLYFRRGVMGSGKSANALMVKPALDQREGARIVNARFDENGVGLKEGKQVVPGADGCCIGLCRKRWKQGDLGPVRL